MKSIIALIFLVTCYSLHGQNRDSLMLIPTEFGIFKTFDDFKNNKPDNSKPFKIELEERKTITWAGTYKSTLRFEEDNQKVKDIWGFSDGKKIFIWHQWDFFEVEIVNQKLAFYGYDKVTSLMEDPESRNSAALSVLGFLTKLSLNGSSSGSSRMTKEKAKHEKVLYFIDPYYGLPLNQMEYKIQQLNDKNAAQIILYRVGDKNNKNDILIEIQDSLKYTFESRSYLKVNIPIANKSTKICANNECGIFKLYGRETRYVQVQFSEDNNRAELVTLDKSKASFQAEKSKIKQKKKGWKVPIVD